MTELGVYILGAVALCILAAAGIAVGNPTAVLCAVLSSGAAYLSQLGAALTVAGVGGKAPQWLNGAMMLMSFAAWVYGAALLLGA